MLKPLGGRVLVKPLESEAKSTGGIYLPDSAQKRPQEGKVIAVGEGKVSECGKVEPMPVAVGDIVIYPEYGGTEVKFDNEEYLLIDCDSLLAIRTSDEKPAAKAKKK
ncbi:MAG: co-chaperone GroES [Actinobacteria bacterium]|nr:co-chaperone GroES [Actinomycetota bacterium]